jgi:hypothetical protein
VVGRAREDLAELSRLAAQSGLRLDVKKDPLLAPIARAFRVVYGARTPLALAATSCGSPQEVADLAERLKVAAKHLSSASGVALEAAVDAAAATIVKPELLRDLAFRVAAEALSPEPSFSIGVVPESPVLVRVPGSDWETIWRNLFGNAIAAAQSDGRHAQLGLGIERRRDPVTGEAIARLSLADDVPGTVTAEMIRGRAVDRGWGIIADLVLRNGGSVDVAVTSPPWRKAIVLEFPAAEDA